MYSCFSKQVKCNYEDKNEKELIVNKTMMAITQKEWRNTFLSIVKSAFININKNDLIKVIYESDIIIDNYVNIIL